MAVLARARNTNDSVSPASAAAKTARPVEPSGEWCGAEWAMEITPVSARNSKPLASALRSRHTR
jgi:hypothetical protein